MTTPNNDIPLFEKIESLSLRFRSSKISSALVAITKILNEFTLPVLVIYWIPALLGYITPGITIREAGFNLLFITVTSAIISAITLDSLRESKRKKLIPPKILWLINIITTLISIFIPFTVDWLLGVLVILLLTVSIVYSKLKKQKSLTYLTSLTLESFTPTALLFLISFMWAQAFSLEIIIPAILLGLAYSTINMMMKFQKSYDNLEEKKKLFAAIVIFVCLIPLGLFFSLPAVSLTGIIMLPFYIHAIIKKRDLKFLNKILYYLFSFFVSFLYLWLFPVVVIFYFINKFSLYNESIYNESISLSKSE